MKNPFAMMAMMAAAMSAAFRENAYRDAGVPLPTGRGKSRLPGKRNPAGSKFVLRAFKAKHGVKAESVEEAWEWYRGYLAAKDAEARKREADRKAWRAARNRCTCYLLPHTDECALYLGITKSGESVFAEPV